MQWTVKFIAVLTVIVQWVNQEQLTWPLTSNYWMNHTLYSHGLHKKCSQWSNQMNSATSAWSDEANTSHWPKIVFLAILTWKWHMTSNYWTIQTLHMYHLLVENVHSDHLYWIMHYQLGPWQQAQVMGWKTNFWYFGPEND